MARVASNTGHDKIHAALKKLKDGSNAKELELIELVASVYETLKDTQDKAAEKVREGATNLNTSVHLHPWSYIGGAALCGILAGLLVRR